MEQRTASEELTTKIMRLTVGADRNPSVEGCYFFRCPAVRSRSMPDTFPRHSRFILWVGA